MTPPGPRARRAATRGISAVGTTGCTGERCVTDVLPLSSGADADATFDSREGGTLKMILVPRPGRGPMPQAAGRLATCAMAVWSCTPTRPVGSRPPR